jgi:hypothetical protein
MLLSAVALWKSKSGSMMKRVRFDAFDAFDAFDDPKVWALRNGHFKFEAQR